LGGTGGERTNGRAHGERARPGSYTDVTDDDKQMDRAVENAQKTLGFFIAALKAKKDGDTTFEIKKCFIDGDKVEHLWIRKVRFDGKNFTGRSTTARLK
jgi:uncharacterized protein YegJ (DUF2314 family)